MTAPVFHPAPELHVVLGAGPLGRATAEALIALGRRVRIVNRTGQMVAPPEQAELVAAELTDPAAARRAVSGATSVYFCAQPPYHLWSGYFPALQAGALAATEAAGARFIAAENLYGYGPRAEPLREDMRLRPNTRKGKVRAVMHETLMEAHASGRVRAAVARGSDFFGPGVEGSAVGGRAMRAVAAGRTVEVFGDPDAPHAYTFIGDFGRTLATLGTDDRGLGQVWHVPNAQAVSTRRFFEIAFRLVGKPAKLRRMSLAELRLLGLFIRPLREAIEMRYEFEAPFLVDTSRFETGFGISATPLESALWQTLAPLIERSANRPNAV
jgi:nucleoside-diphosphate-sugar epimerase